MKRSLLGGLLLVALFPLFFGSCGDDDGPAIAGISFELTGEEVFESDGTLTSFHPLLINDAEGITINVKVVLDKPAAETIVVAFSIDGTADKNSTSNPIGDFDIDGNASNFIINKGESQATIAISLFEDFEFEADEFDDDDYPFETIILKLTSIVSGPGQLGTQDTYTLTVYEDDTIIFLDWDPQDDPGSDGGDVDMDLLVWLDGELLGGDDTPGTDPAGIAIPAGFPDGKYGFSYTYYSGSSDDLDFFVDFMNFGGTLTPSGSTSPSEALSFDGTYTAVNRNPYGDDTDPEFKGDPLVVQETNKGAFNYTNVTGITIPVSGSRTKSTQAVLTDLLRNNKIRFNQLSFPGKGEIIRRK